ncbi:MAG TPA: serine/threonine-protein kinase [Kofleriaceae bacterium]|nr:serine/threonine-protein kinase [Kofleriaceae bacterium]
MPDSSAPSAPTLPTSLDADLEPGQEVGEYQIENKLGQGAFGTVYKAAHPLIGKVVAIKVLATKLSVDPEMVSRFIAEARAVNQIRQRNIIDIFSFGKLADGRQYYVMEYLDGEPLDALLDRVGNLSLADALPILRPIAKALDAAHAKGIAHRDLKAENIFLGTESDGVLFPKLLDFGIAKLMGNEETLKHKTRTGSPIGTPYYMSPEQCLGKDVDHRTDIYAFGILVFKMLTGAYPFDADDYMSILMQQLNADAPAPSTHLPDLPASIDDVVLWLLAKDPAQRPPDLRTAVKALEHAAQEAGLDIGRIPSDWDVQTSPSGKPFQTQPPPRRTNVVTAPAKPALTNPSRAVTTGAGAARAKSSRIFIAATALASLALIAAIVFVVAKKSPSSSQNARPTGGHEVAEVAPVPSRTPDATPDAGQQVAEVASVPNRTPDATAAVIVTVAGVPDGTEVLVAGKVIGAAPGPVQLERGTAAVVLTFRADGYLPTSKSVVPDGDKLLDAALKKKPKVSGGGHRPGRDDIIDVFGGGKK